MSEPANAPVRVKRADAQRNEKALLEAAATVFVESGVDAPVREIAAEAGVGTGTIYRHFPKRSDLVIAVYRHQVEACAEAGPKLLHDSADPFAALVAWVDIFVDFLVTKHGLAGAMRNDQEGFEGLHDYFIERLVPVCEELLEAARGAHKIAVKVEAFALMFGIGNLCAYSGADPRYDARQLVHALLAGLRAPLSR